MTVFNSYSVGTAGVINGQTIVNGAGTLWSGINVRPGDDLVLDGHTVVILDVIGTTQLQIDPWPYASVPVSSSPASPYKIIWRSPLRYAGGQAMADVDTLIASLSNPIFSGLVIAPTVAGGSGAASQLVLESTSGAGTTDAIIFKTASQVEQMRIDTNGLITIGGTTNKTGARLELHGLSAAQGQIFSARWDSGSANSVAMIQGKSRGGTIGTHTIVQNGDSLALWWAQGSDGAVFQSATQILSQVDGAPGVGSMPGRLMFLTTPASTVVAVERMRIDNAGIVSIFSTTVSTTKTSGALLVSGGVGVAGQVTANSFQYIPTTLASGVALVVPSTSAANITNGSNLPLTGLTVGACMIMVVNRSSGAWGLYVGYAGITFNLVSGSSEFVAPTTTPAGGKSSVANNGTTATIYNNTGGTGNYNAMAFNLQ